MPKKNKPTTIERAVATLVEDRDRRLCARPIHWRGSAEALLLHAGNLYRVAPGLRPLDGPAHSIDATMIVAKWETLSVVDVLREAEPAPAEERKPREPREPRKPREATVPRSDRRDRRGRPSAAELRAELPIEERDAWIGVAEAAELAGVSRDRIRRAISAGALAVRTVRNVTFVEAAVVRGLVVSTSDRELAPAATPAAPVEAPATTPVEAAADVDPFAESFS